MLLVFRRHLSDIRFVLNRRWGGSGSHWTPLHSGLADLGESGIVVLNILYVDLIQKDNGKKAVDDKATVFSVKSLNQENTI